MSLIPWLEADIEQLCSGSKPAELRRSLQLLTRSRSQTLINGSFYYICEMWDSSFSIPVLIHEDALLPSYALLDKFTINRSCFAVFVANASSRITVESPSPGCLIVQKLTKIGAAPPPPNPRSVYDVPLLRMLFSCLAWLACGVASPRSDVIDLGYDWEPSECDPRAAQIVDASLAKFLAPQMRRFQASKAGAKAGTRSALYNDLFTRLQVVEMDTTVPAGAPTRGIFLDLDDIPRPHRPETPDLDDESHVVFRPAMVPLCVPPMSPPPAFVSKNELAAVDYFIDDDQELARAQYDPYQGSVAMPPTSDAKMPPFVEMVPQRGDVTPAQSKWEGATSTEEGRVASSLQPSMASGASARHSSASAPSPPAGVHPDTASSPVSPVFPYSIQSPPVVLPESASEDDIEEVDLTQRMEKLRRGSHHVLAASTYAQGDGVQSPTAVHSPAHPVHAEQSAEEDGVDKSGSQGENEGTEEMVVDDWAEWGDGEDSEDGVLSDAASPSPKATNAHHTKQDSVASIGTPIAASVASIRSVSVTPPMESVPHREEPRAAFLESHSPPEIETPRAGPGTNESVSVSSPSRAKASRKAFRSVILASARRANRALPGGTSVESSSESHAVPRTPDYSRNLIRVSPVKSPAPPKASASSHLSNVTTPCSSLRVKEESPDEYRIPYKSRTVKRRRASRQTDPPSATGAVREARPRRSQPRADRRRSVYVEVAEDSGSERDSTEAHASSEDVKPLLGSERFRPRSILTRPGSMHPFDASRVSVVVFIEHSGPLYDRLRNLRHKLPPGQTTTRAERPGSGTTLTSAAEPGSE